MRFFLAGVLGMAVAQTVCGGQYQVGPGSIDVSGESLRQFLNGMHVEQYWLPSSNSIDWQTGMVVASNAFTSVHTHCSAFAAAFCLRQQVYLLRPTNHSTVLLANAQYIWLTNGVPDGVSGTPPSATEAGWFQLTNGTLPDQAVEAQARANVGQVVVASYANTNLDDSGHIVVVRPADNRSETLIRRNGPRITQAGGHNYPDTTLSVGFNDEAWNTNGTGKVRFFANTNFVPFVKISGLSGQGWLRWSNSSIIKTCRVEWASSLATPVWQTLTNIAVTNTASAALLSLPPASPLFFRLSGEMQR
jgi:hypothetical protein